MLAVLEAKICVEVVPRARKLVGVREQQMLHLLHLNQNGHELTFERECDHLREEGRLTCRWTSREQHSAWRLARTTRQPLSMEGLQAACKAARVVDLRHGVTNVCAGHVDKRGLAKQRQVRAKGICALQLLGGGV